MSRQGKRLIRVRVDISPRRECMSASVVFVVDGGQRKLQRKGSLAASNVYKRKV